MTLISASIAENVDRQDFDVIEEAKAVDALVKECGSAVEAANRLRKTASLGLAAAGAAGAGPATANRFAPRRIGDPGSPHLGTRAA